MKKKQYSYDDFLKIIETLRSENGCPWDREQTHTSLRPCLMEESAEVMAAIRILDRTGSYENLREELGDVLLQVVMHSQIAKEEGLFTMEDVVNEVAEKMIRRHPHVFGEGEADNSEQVLKNWEDIKKKEKEGKEAPESPLREIPLELPALARAAKVLKKADKLYECGPDYESAVAELQKAVNALEQKNPQDSDLEILIGDILMSVSGISHICKLPQEQILSDRVESFIENWEKTP